jgi:prepilin-type N-terminal cleavage/methylation domain-containing protein
MGGDTGRRNARAGFTLIEVMLALSAFAVIVVSLGRATNLLGRQSTNAMYATYRDSEVARQVGRLSAMEFDSLSAQTGCATIITAPFPHTRCITVTDVTAGQKRVTLVITPAYTVLHPDTTTFDRIASATNPFGF